MDEIGHRRSTLGVYARGSVGIKDRLLTIDKAGTFSASIDIHGRRQANVSKRAA